MTSQVRTIEQRLEELSKNPPKYQIIKDKKTNELVYIKDGFFKFKVNLANSLTCQCGATKKAVYCDHILFVLSKYFGLSSLVISFLEVPAINEQFLLLLTTTASLDTELHITLDSHFSKHDCGICLDKLNSTKYKFDLFRCKTCQNYVHANCMTTWKTYKTSDTKLLKPCIYCSQ